MTATITNERVRSHRAPGKINYDAPEYGTAEHLDWKKHRRALLAVNPRHVGWRGCLGLAMMIVGDNEQTWLQHGSSAFVPNDQIRWASIVDIPPFMLEDSDFPDVHRERHWATVRPATVRFGMPALTRGSEGRNAWDFKCFPFSPTTVVNDDGEEVVRKPSRDTLDPGKHPQYFRVFNAINWAMTSYAFHHLKSWRVRRKRYYDLLDLEFDPTQTAMRFGDSDRFYSQVESPAQWMPQPYIAFPEAMRDSLFDAAVLAAEGVSTDTGVVYHRSFVAAFCAALTHGLEYRAPFAGRLISVRNVVLASGTQKEIRFRSPQGEECCQWFGPLAKVRVTGEFEAGQVLADEPISLPEDYAKRSVMAQWHDARASLGAGLEFLSRLWFDRQLLRLQPGYVHVLASLSSKAAFVHAADSQLLWDVDPCVEYFNGASDAYVFPPIIIDRPYTTRWSGGLLGCIDISVLPSDRRFGFEPVVTPSMPS